MLFSGPIFVLFATSAAWSASIPFDDGDSPLSQWDPQEFYRDCQRCIQRLPTDPARQPYPMLFDRHPQAGLYRLPTWRKSGRCGVFIMIKVDARSDRSSWRDVKRKFDDMNRACRGQECVKCIDYTGLREDIELKLQWQPFGSHTTSNDSSHSTGLDSTELFS